jgi:hypothetical protein
LTYRFLHGTVYSGRKERFKIHDANHSELRQKALISLLAQFRSAVKRGCDYKLARVLEEDFLAGDTPRVRTSTITRLAKWCKTDGIYADGMNIARKISLLLFGQILDRDVLGV